MKEPAFLKAGLDMLGFKYEENGNTISLNSLSVGRSCPTFTKKDANSSYEFNYSQYDDYQFSMSSTDKDIQKTIESMKIKSAQDFQNRVVGAYNLSRQMEVAIQAGYAVDKTTITERETIVRLTRSAGGF
jgi:hypothetical protein